jgi:hypothetical protein
MVLRSRHRHARRPPRSDVHRAPKLVDPRLIDHAVGIELQLVDVVEQTARARVQGAHDEAADLEREIDRLHTELAETAARVAAGSEREP